MEEIVDYVTKFRAKAQQEANQNYVESCKRGAQYLLDIPRKGSVMNSLVNKKLKEDPYRNEAFFCLDDDDFLPWRRQMGMDIRNCLKSKADDPHQPPECKELQKKFNHTTYCSHFKFCLKKS